MGKKQIVRARQHPRQHWDARWRMVPVTLHTVGFYLVLFVLLFCLASLVLGVAIPLSVAANRWLVAFLALGCLLERG